MIFHISSTEASVYEKTNKPNVKMSDKYLDNKIEIIKRIFSNTSEDISSLRMAITPNVYSASY